MSDTGVVRTGRLRDLGRAYVRQRYAILFYTLLLTMVAAPGFAAVEFPGGLIELLLATNLLAAVVPVGTTKSRSALLTVTTVVWLGRPIAAWLDHPALSGMTLGPWALIGMLAAAAALR